MGEAAGTAPAGGAELIADPTLLRELEGEWRSLAERRGNAFLTPEWFRAWLRHYGVHAELAVLVARRPDGTLRGLLPLACEHRGRRSTLRFAGANLADHLHPVAGDEAEEVEVAAAAGAALAAGPASWSTIILDNVDSGAAWVRAFSAAVPASLAPTRSRQASLPYAELPDSWDVYLAARSRNFRSQLGRKLRGLERDYRVRFRLTDAAGDLERDLETFFRLHDARWDQRGGSSSRGDRVRAFHADFSAAALERGWLRLWLMEVDGEPAAAWYGWCLGGRYSYYLAGFSPRWSGASVGLLLLAHTVRAAIEEGASVYDMLLGQEAYKERFASSGRPVETIALARSFHPARLLIAAEAASRRVYTRLPDGVRDRARSVTDRLRPRLPSSRPR